MGYVGRGLNQEGGQYRKLDDISSGFNGSETSFSLTVSNLAVTPTAQNLLISINGVIQEPGSAFSMNGSTITFTEAPAGAASFFGVVMGEASYIAYDTVGANELGVTAGTVKASRGVVVDTSSNVSGFNRITSTSGSFNYITASIIDTDASTIRVGGSPISKTLVDNLTTMTGSGTVQGTGTTDTTTFAGGTYTGDLGVSGSMTVKGTLTAQEFKTEFVSASITFTSGSTKFGDTSDDVHNMTGSLNISGSFNVNNGTSTVNALTAESITTSGNISGSSTSTGSFGVVSIGGSPSEGGSKLGVDGNIEMLSGSNRLFVPRASDGALTTSIFSRTGNNLTLSGAGSSGGQIEFIPSSANSSAVAMTIDSSQNVSIGNTAASTINSANNGGRLVVGDGSGNDGMTIYSGNGSGEYGVVYFADGTSGASTYQGWMAYYHDTNQLSLGTAGDHRVRITASGKVGIGTTSPGHLLTVAGATDGDNPSIHIIAHSSDSGSIWFGESATNKNGGIEYDNSGQDMYFTTNSSRKMTLDTSGNLGIGVTTPGYLTELRVNDTVTDTPRLVIRQIGAGDSSLAFQMPDSPYGWVMGADNSDSDRFKISTGVGDLDSSPRFEIDPGGTTIHRYTGAENTIQIHSGIGSNTTGTSQIYFSSKDQYGGNTHQSYIKSTIDGSSSTSATKMTFHNRDSGGTVQEYMAIRADGLVQINQNNAGSVGTSNKQLSVGASLITQFDRSNVGTMTGITVSNSYTDGTNQSGTATGIVFSHHTSSSGISYIASVAGSNSGDRSALHFGTRGSSGVKERLLLNDNGEVYIGHGGDGYLKHYQINSNSHHWVLYPYSDDSYRFNRNGSGSDEMTIASDGDVTILGTLTESSDIRLKENIETIPNALSKVNQLRGVTYNWNETSGKDTEAKQIGMIADEVEEVVPELVKTDSVKGAFDEDGLDNIKSLKYGNVVGLLVEAVKELTARIEALES